MVNHDFLSSANPDICASFDDWYGLAAPSISFFTPNSPTGMLSMISVVGTDMADHPHKWSMDGESMQVFTKQDASKTPQSQHEPGTSEQVHS